MLPRRVRVAGVPLGAPEVALPRRCGAATHAFGLSALGRVRGSPGKSLTSLCTVGGVPSSFLAGSVFDAVLDTDAPRGVRFALSLVHLLVPLRSVLLEPAVRWRGHVPVSLPAQALVAGVGEGPQAPTGTDVQARSASRSRSSPMAWVMVERSAPPAGRYVVSDPVAEMDERGQEPVDEHQSMLRTDAHGPLQRSRDKSVGV